MLRQIYLHPCPCQYQQPKVGNDSSLVKNRVQLYLGDPLGEVSTYITLSMPTYENLVHWT